MLDLDLAVSALGKVVLDLAAQFCARVVIEVVGELIEDFLTVQYVLQVWPSGYRATSLWDGQPEVLTPPLPEAPATLDVLEGQLAGTTGCNYYVYNYRADGQTLIFGEPRWSLTMMACEEPRMQQETAFIRLLDAVDRYERSGDRLTLAGAEGVLVFAPSPSLPLEGTRWQLGGLAHNQAVVSMAGDEAITLTLADGQAVGFAGCNDYFGAYTLEANALRFGPLGATKKACASCAVPVR